MNTAQPPFDNKLVRQAVYWALDRDAIRQVAYFGAGEIGHRRGADRLELVRRRPARRRRTSTRRSRCWQQAGVTDAAEGRVPRPAAVPGAVEDRRGDAAAAEGRRHQDEHQAGRRSACGSTRSSRANYQITSAYQERTIDPDNFYALVVRTGGDINTTGYSNPQVDQLIDQARTETDERHGSASTSRSGRSCSRTRRSSSRTTRRSTI